MERRVVAYGIDILIENEKDNEVNLNELIVDILERNGIKVCAVDFKADVSKYYEGYL